MSHQEESHERLISVSHVRKLAWPLHRPLQVQVTVVVPQQCLVSKYDLCLSIWAGDEVETRPTVGSALDVHGKYSRGHHLYS